MQFTRQTPRRPPHAAAVVASVAAGKQQGRGVNTVAEVIEIDDEEQPAGTPIDNSRHVFDLVTVTAFGLCICGSGGPAQSESLIVIHREQQSGLCLLYTSPSPRDS